MTWPHPMLWTSLPDRGGWWQCLQHPPAAGIYAGAAYGRLGKDFPSSLAFGMILVFNFASLSHSCFRASPGIVSIYLWWCDFFGMGRWQRLLHPQTQTFIADVLKEQQQCLSLARSPLGLKMPPLDYFPLPSCSRFHPHQLDDDLCRGHLHQTGMLETRRWAFPGILLPHI